MYFITVFELHFGHTKDNSSILHFKQKRLTTSIDIFCNFEASVRLRLEPPDKPTGYRTFTRGFISLGRAFSGLPIRAPMKVPALSLILILERYSMRSNENLKLVDSIFLKGFKDLMIIKVFS